MANVFFNAEYYLANNADLIRAGFSADNPDALWNHYVQYGAQESTLDNNRAPNPWFDVNYYLAANPDLNAAGLTASDALVHYATYGINEPNREFSSTVSIADFDAVTYAEENKDLRDAFGIEADFDELTEEQAHNLLVHYLAYGYAEEREGAGDIADEIAALDELVVSQTADGKGINNIGTIGNDKFIVNDDDADNIVVDGLGGTDTVVFEGATDADTTLKNIEKVVVNSSGEVTFESQKLLEQIKLGEDATVVNAEFIAVAGSADVLNVVSDSDATLITNGIETVNLELGKDVAAFTSLEVNKTQGDTFTVNLKGGAAAGFTLTAIENEGSTTVKNFTLDGSELKGGLTTGTFGELVNVNNVTIKGSATAANDFDTLVVGIDVSKSLTVVGGSEADTFTATTAIDTFTGGKGENIFTFEAANTEVRLDKDGKIAAVDTITDFGKDDTFSGIALKGFEKTGSAVDFDSVEAYVDYLTSAANTDAANAFTTESGDTYIILSTVGAGTGTEGDYEGVSLVKLAGVTVENLQTWGNVEA